MIITTSGERSTLATVGITRWSGRRKGRVREFRSGAIGLYGFTQDSTAWRITTAITM